MDMEEQDKRGQGDFHIHTQQENERAVNQLFTTNFIKSVVDYFTNG